MNLKECFFIVTLTTIIKCSVCEDIAESSEETEEKKSEIYKCSRIDKVRIFCNFNTRAEDMYVEKMCMISYFRNNIHILILVTRVSTSVKSSARNSN